MNISILFYFILIFSSSFTIKVSAQLQSPSTFSVNWKPEQAGLKAKVENQFKFNFEALTLSEIDEVLRFIHLSENLKHASVFKNKNQEIQFETEPLPKIEKLNWLNVNLEQQKELNKLTNLKLNQVFDKDFLDLDLERIKDIYISKGYNQFQIHSEVINSANNNIHLNVQINFGPQTRISDIQIKCKSPSLKKSLLKLVQGSIHSIYHEEDLLTLKQTFLEYLADNDHIRAEIIGPHLTFEKNNESVSIEFQIEKEEIYKINFTGQKSYSKSKLLKALELQNFFSASPRIDVELAHRLKKFYLSEAFALVEIQSFENKGKHEFEKIINFDIKENQRIQIQSINFSGVYSRPENYYLSLLNKTATELVLDKYYYRESFDTSLKSFINEIQDQGFLQSKIISFRSNYDEKKTKVQILINFDEGPQTIIKNISFTGNVNISKSKLLETVGFSENQPFQLQKLKKSIQSIKSLYYDSGFIEMGITNEFEDLVKYSLDNTMASINFNIFEGPLVKVAAIVIEGNSFTQENVILNEIDLKLGDIVTPESLESSQTNLQRTGFFNTVSVKTLEERTTVSNRTLIISVTERDPGLFTLGLGATNERGLTFRAYTGIAYNNLKGTGRGLSLRMEGNYNLTLIKYPQSKIILGYLEPYLFETNIKGRLGLTRNEYISNYDTQQATILNQVSFNLEKRFTQEFSGIWNLWSLATVRDFSISNQAAPSSVEDTSVNIASIGPFLDLDYRNNPFQPSQGFLARFAFEYSDPLLGSSQEINYWLSTASFTHYLNLTPKLSNPVIFANQLRAGYIENISPLSTGAVPYDKKGFILGGRDTIRGFEAGTSESFPNSIDLGSEKYLLTTNSQMFLIKSELRFPFYKELGGALFYDGGMVFIKNQPFEDYYRDAVGFGLRYNTPLGAVNLEIAFKLDRKSYESSERVHLSIGTF
ncbi:MAG TPA: POTRA domain-containing protein [Pseudobdellovibrionaceae bacterium]|nr:POTRA domain-containing protein [Pseudobdellovibrionaceae bacterium]